MIGIALTFAYGCFGLAMLLCLFRAIRGPGLPDRVLQPMLDDFTHVRPRLSDPAELEQLATVERWTLAASEQLRPQLLERKAGGWIRECHGDLHP